MTARDTEGATARLNMGRDAGYVLGAQVLAIGLAFVVNAIAARTLAPEEFAALAWAITWLAWLALLAQLGLVQASTVIMAVEGDARLRDRLRSIVGAVLINAVVVAALWWLVVGPLIAGASEDDASYRGMVGVVALWVPVAAVAPVIAGLLRGLHRFRDAALYGEYVRRVALLAAIITVVAAELDREAATVVALAVAAESLIALIVVVALDRSARTLPETSRPTDERSLRRRGLSFVLPTIDAPLLPQAGVWILALVRPATEVAVLSVGIGISFVFGLPVFVGARVLGPRYARVHAGEGDLRALEPTARRHATLSFAFVALATIGLVVFGDWAVGLVFGEQYEDAATVAVIIGLGAVVNAATGSCAAALMHCGHEKIVGITAALAAAVYVVSGLAMGNQWGSNGVAAAAALVISSRNLYLAVATRRRLGLTTWMGRARRSSQSRL